MRRIGRPIEIVSKIAHEEFIRSISNTRDTLVSGGHISLNAHSKPTNRMQSCGRVSATVNPPLRLARRMLPRVLATLIVAYFAAAPNAQGRTSSFKPDPEAC